MRRLLLFLLCVLSARFSMAEDAEAPRIRSQTSSLAMSEKVTLSNDQWRRILTPAQFTVLRKGRDRAAIQERVLEQSPEGDVSLRSMWK